MKSFRHQRFRFLDDAGRLGEMIEPERSVAIEEERIDAGEILEFVGNPSQLVTGDVEGDDPAHSVFLQFCEIRGLLLSFVFQFVIFPFD